MFKQVSKLLLIFSIYFIGICESTCVPTDVPCSNECINTDGWVKNAGTNVCEGPTDCKTGLKCNGANKVQACLSLGYVKSSSDDSCVDPSDSDCLDTITNLNMCANYATLCKVKGYIKLNSNSNLCGYPDCSKAGMCGSTLTACTIQGFTKGASDECIAPTDCLTSSQCGGSFLKPACLSIGYVNNKGVCKAPTIEDCLENILIPYRCSSLSNLCTTAFGLVKVSNSDTSCSFPDCTVSGKCADNIAACTFKGYTKNPNNNDCVSITDDNCLDTTKNQNLCASWNNICTIKGYVKYESNNTCKLPNCESGNLCDGVQTACTYQGYISGTGNSCVKPSDCKASNKSLCSTYKQFCKKNGYVKSSVNDDCVCSTSAKETNGLCVQITESYSNLLISYLFAQIAFILFV